MLTTRRLKPEWISAAAFDHATTGSSSLPRNEPSRLRVNAPTCAFVPGGRGPASLQRPASARVTAGARRKSPLKRARGANGDKQGHHSAAEPTVKRLAWSPSGKAAETACGTTPLSVREALLSEPPAQAGRNSAGLRPQLGQQQPSSGPRLERRGLARQFRAGFAPARRRCSPSIHACGSTRLSATCP